MATLEDELTRDARKALNNLVNDSMRRGVLEIRPVGRTHDDPDIRTLGAYCYRWAWQNSSGGINGQRQLTRSLAEAFEALRPDIRRERFSRLRTFIAAALQEAGLIEQTGYRNRTTIVHPPSQAMQREIPMDEPEETTEQQLQRLIAEASSMEIEAMIEDIKALRRDRAEESSHAVWPGGQVVEDDEQEEGITDQDIEELRETIQEAKKEVRHLPVPRPTAPSINQLLRVVGLEVNGPLRSQPGVVLTIRLEDTNGAVYTTTMEMPG